MSDLKFQIDAAAIASMFGDLKAEVEDALTQSVKQLASMTYAKTAELANQNLRTTRQKYLDALEYQEIAPGVWVVGLDESAMFIEEGRKSGQMHDDLLKNGAKVSKDGFRYKSIPFDQSKPSSQQTDFGRQMLGLIKSELKRQNIPFKKLEYDKNGSPRIGKLHTMNIESPYPTASAKTKALYGLSIYQNKNAQGKVQRSIMTFRTISEKTKSEGGWFHPGLEARKFMDQAFSWAVRTWEEEILPNTLKRFE